MSLVEKSLKTAVDFSVQASLSAAQTSYSTLQKIVAKPGNIKKTLEIAEKAVKGLDYYHGHNHYPQILNGMSQSISVMGFYDLYKNYRFWINPFDVKNIDKKLLKETLLTSLKQTLQPTPGAETPSTATETPLIDFNPIVEQILDKVLNDPKLSSTKEIVAGIKQELLAVEGLTEQQVQAILSKVKVQFNQRIYSTFAMAYCETVYNFKGAVSTCDQICDQLISRFNIIGAVKFASLAETIGTKVPVFLVIIKAATETASKGYILLGVGGFAYALHKLVKVQKMINSESDDAKKSEAYKTRKEILWKMAVGTAALASAVAPVFTVSPPILITLGFISTGTGFVKILAN